MSVCMPRAHRASARACPKTDTPYGRPFLALCLRLDKGRGGEGAVPYALHSVRSAMWVPCTVRHVSRTQGFFRIIKSQGGGGPLPQNPLPPSPDQSDHRGKKRNLQ